jgi:hypothetical protein
MDFFSPNILVVFSPGVSLNFGTIVPTTKHQPIWPYAPISM